MADRPFTLRQTRPWSQGDRTEVVTIGTGVDHEDGTVTLTPIPGMGRESRESMDDLRAMLAQNHGGFTTELLYDADQG